MYFLGAYFGFDIVILFVGAVSRLVELLVNILLPMLQTNLQRRSVHRTWQTDSFQHSRNYADLVSLLLVSTDKIRA